MPKVEKLKSNLIKGRIPAGESCFLSVHCKEKDTVCNGQGCPVADDKTTSVEFSCALARMAAFIYKKG